MKTRTKVFWFIGIAIALFWPILMGLQAGMVSPSLGNQKPWTFAVIAGLAFCIDLALMISFIWPLFAFFVKKYEEKQLLFSFHVHSDVVNVNQRTARTFCEEFTKALKNENNHWKTKIKEGKEMLPDKDNPEREYFFVILTDTGKLLAAIPLKSLSRLVVYEDWSIATIQKILGDRTFRRIINQRLGHAGYRLLVDIVD